MRLLKTNPHLSDEKLFEHWKSQTETRAYQDWQIIYSVQVNYGKTSKELSKVLGVTDTKIRAVVQSYNKNGVNWRIFGKWGGRREARSYLTLEEEKSLLLEVENDALEGKILIYKHIKDIVEKRVGKEVSDDYIWDLFNRHNWKKKVPRQSHPLADKEKQEEYKKKIKENVDAKSLENTLMPTLHFVPKPENTFHLFFLMQIQTAWIYLWMSFQNILVIIE